MNKYNFSKKICAVFLGGAMSVSLVGCNSKKESEIAEESSSAVSYIDSDVSIERVYNDVYDIHGHKIDFISIYNEDGRLKGYKASYTNIYSYVTKVDETLKSISMNCNVNISQILDTNSVLDIDYSNVNFEDEVLPYGTSLKIKYVKEYPYLLTQEEKDSFYSDFYYYNVSDGECLSQISTENNKSDRVIKILNDLDGDLIYVDQQLLMPKNEYNKVYKKEN